MNSRIVNSRIVNSRIINLNEINTSGYHNYTIISFSDPGDGSNYGGGGGWNV